jgi:hypothetical protein
MGDWPRYALNRATARMTKAVLLDMLADVPADLRREGDTASKEAMVTVLNTAAAAWLDSPPTERNGVRRLGFKGLTATECNEWLATLPPVPLAGEADHG